MGNQQLADQLKAQARRLGFEWVGVTRSDPPPHLDVYERWLEAGRHGEMGYLAHARARTRRAHPQEILPECRSILVLGMRHPDPGSQSRPAGVGPFGRVAAYALGADYHDILPARLQSLVAFLEERIGQPVPHRWYTDTGPILERDLAQRAGLGWIGKNTCLIHPRQGSYFLLAELFLGVDLEPDPPFVHDHCGTCTRCRDACPTACILPDRTLDARQCISYLTIEIKGAIPVDLRPKLGEWVFGCDICQQVCPWNRRFAAPEGDPAFNARPGVHRPDLIQDLALTQEAFAAKFRGSPVKRARRRGYLRNVAVALGNAREPRAIPSLARVLTEEGEPLVRQHAAWALGQIGGEAAHKALSRALRSEADPAVRAEIGAARQVIQGSLARDP